MWEKIVQWFIKHAWPKILEMIEKLIPVIMEWFARFLEEAMRKKTTQKASQAEEKAQTAADKAKEATSEAEAAAFRAEAETWRKIAEDYKQELSEIKQMLRQAQQDSEPVVNAEVSQIKPEKLFTHTKDGQLKLNPSQLPTLPPPKQ